MRFLVFLAILPSILLAKHVYTRDRVEKEPFGLLAKLFVFGMISCIPAAFIESFGESLITSITSSPGLISLLTYMVLVPGAEESVKYLALRTTWRSREFNYTFDGVVYAVMVGLGFATLENVLYVLEFADLQTAIMRGIFAVPMHCTCAVFMGYYYGVARGLDANGKPGESKRARKLALLVPWIIHGLYDYSLDTDSGVMLIAGLICTLLVFILASRRVRYASEHDEPITVGYEAVMPQAPGIRAAGPTRGAQRGGRPPRPFNM